MGFHRGFTKTSQEQEQIIKDLQSPSKILCSQDLASKTQNSPVPVVHQYTGTTLSPSQFEMANGQDIR